MNACELHLQVRALTWEAENILGVELVPTQSDALLPSAGAGAHIDLQLPGGLRRSYSLLDGDRHRYRIAVHRAPDSRGGSRWVHDRLRPGAQLVVSAPRNHFPLAETAACSVFIAGGIGITPILAMVARAKELGQSWSLHYAARTRRHAAFLDRLEQLARDGNAPLYLHFDDEHGGKPLDLAATVRALPPQAHVYCCGPAAMLAAYAQATAHLPAERVHLEAFAGVGGPADAKGYRVELARSGKTLQVAPGQTLLDALIAAGTDPMYSCREGVCGTCEVRVLAGVPEHRDLVLTPEQQQANDRMLPCCSGARGEHLVLDL